MLGNNKFKLNKTLVRPLTTFSSVTYFTVLQTSIIISDKDYQ